MKFNIPLLRGFNPTLVRLRLALVDFDYDDVVRFQSHAGSIEALGQLARTFGDEKFQSHAGSIEADPQFGVANQE